MARRAVSPVMPTKSLPRALDPGARHDGTGVVRATLEAAIAGRRLNGQRLPALMLSPHVADGDRGSRKLAGGNPIFDVCSMGHLKEHKKAGGGAQHGRRCARHLLGIAGWDREMAPAELGKLPESLAMHLAELDGQNSIG